MPHARNTCLPLCLLQILFVLQDPSKRLFVHSFIHSFIHSEHLLGVGGWGKYGEALAGAPGRACHLVARSMVSREPLDACHFGVCLGH